MPRDHRLRVVIVVWRLGLTGGVQNVVRNVLGGLDLQRFDVHVLTVRPALAEDRLGDFPGVSFHSLEVPASATLTGLGKVALAARLSYALARLRPDVVHVQSGTSAYSALGSTGRGRLRILDVHDAPGSGRHGRLSDRLEGLLCRRGGHLALAHSTSVRDDLRRLYQLPDIALRTVPLGVGDAHFAPPALDGAAWRTGLGLPRDAVLVTYVARLVVTKNVPLFLDVVADVIAASPGLPVHGVVVAEGPERDALQAQIDQLGLTGRLHLVGSRTGPALIDAFHAADVVLSTSDYEGFGLSVVEAMAAAKPVVATAVGGVTDTVADGVTGLLRARGDRGGLVDAVLELVRDPALRQQMGAAGRARAQERFTVQHMVDGYVALYDEARR